MCHGNSENSHGCSYLLRICFIYGTNVSVSRSSIPLQVARCLLIYQQTSANQNVVHLKTGFIWKFHHHHRSAAEQATTSFLQQQRSCANSDSLPGPIMLSVSPKRCWMYLRNRVRCLPGFFFPCGGIYSAYSLHGSSSGILSTWPRNLSWRVLTFSTSGAVWVRS